MYFYPSCTDDPYKKKNKGVQENYWQEFECEFLSPELDAEQEQKQREQVRERHSQGVQRTTRN